MLLLKHQQNRTPYSLTSLHHVKTDVQIKYTESCRKTYVLDPYGVFEPH
jgi:hypothetical protein